MVPRRQRARADQIRARADQALISNHKWDCNAKPANQIHYLIGQARLTFKVLPKNQVFNLIVLKLFLIFSTRLFSRGVDRQFIKFGCKPKFVSL